jgi:hypothetical protein
MPSISINHPDVLHPFPPTTTLHKTQRAVRFGLRFGLHNGLSLSFISLARYITHPSTILTNPSPQNTLGLHRKKKTLHLPLTGSLCLQSSDLDIEVTRGPLARVVRILLSQISEIRSPNHDLHERCLGLFQNRAQRCVRANTNTRLETADLIILPPLAVLEIKIIPCSGIRFTI